jgi:hypothetical protein
MRKRSQQLLRLRVKREMGEHYSKHQRAPRAATLPEAEQPRGKVEVTQRDVFEFRQELDRIGRISFRAHPLLRCI